MHAGKIFWARQARGVALTGFAHPNKSDIQHHCAHANTRASRNKTQSGVRKVNRRWQNQRAKVNSVRPVRHQIMRKAPALYFSLNLQLGRRERRTFFFAADRHHTYVLFIEKSRPVHACMSCTEAVRQGTSDELTCHRESKESTCGHFSI